MRKLVLVLTACVAFAWSASAATVRLAQPANGETLRGGSTATLDWSSLALPAHVEEWEAFLSVDGGRYYAFRITPHLDIDRRNVTFSVPNVDTSDARIMIRVGDERDETIVELPQSFAIVRDANADLPRPAIAPEGKSEAARAGDADVIGWAYGDRSGGRVTQQFKYPVDGRAMSPVAMATALPDLATAPLPNATSLVLALQSSTEKPPVAMRARTRVRPPRTPDVLLASTRLNV